MDRTRAINPLWRFPGTVAAPSSLLPHHSLKAQRRSSEQFFNDSSVSASTPASVDTTFLIVNTPTKPPQKKERNRAPPGKGDRFDRTARSKAQASTPVILTISGQRYNLTAWAHAHPGGAKVLEKYAKSGKDAGEAFVKASHSHMAYELLNDFLIVDDKTTNATSSAQASLTSATSSSTLSCPMRGSAVMPAAQGGAAVIANQAVVQRKPLWRVKLFTREDPQNIHKFLGIYSLLHFAVRIVAMVLIHPTGGLTGAGGKLGAAVAVGSVIPHGVLSASSLIFHTVPKERVVGRPMIWQEFRAHNILFGLRSVTCTVLAVLASLYWQTTPWVRTAAVAGSGAACLGAMFAADYATKKLRVNEEESTTATMPYWEGCSVETQRKFKTFYAFSQFMATMACLSVMNPIWPFLVLLPIQLASLLMTLVRKGLLSAKGYHLAYTASLALPYFVGAAHTVHMATLDFPLMTVLATAMYALRRRGVDKYALWVPVIVGRVLFGDVFLNWRIW